MTLWQAISSRRIIFVTGKGGVGKSTVAAAISSHLAASGKRTLLVDVESKGDSARMLDFAPSGYAIRQVRRNLSHIGLEADALLDEYLGVAMHVPRLYRIGPLHKVFDFIATAAPGVREVLIAGKIGFEERARDKWDVIVVDAAPIGQIASHLRGPKSLQELVDVGMIRNQTTWLREIIENPEKSCVAVVSLLEEMSVVETLELVANLPSSVATPVVGIIANKVLAKCSLPESASSLAREAVDLSNQMAENQVAPRARLSASGLRVSEIPLLRIVSHDAAVSADIGTRLAAQ